MNITMMWLAREIPEQWNLVEPAQGNNGTCVESIVLNYVTIEISMLPVLVVLIFWRTSAPKIGKSNSS